MKRAVVVILAKVDEALDEVLYRPAVVKMFAWSPRWWMCDLAKLSMALDDRWHLGYWKAAGIEPGGPCEVCGRRAAIHVYGGEGDGGGVLADRTLEVCGWCHLRGRILTEDDLAVATAEARAASVAWRWRVRG